MTIPGATTERLAHIIGPAREEAARDMARFVESAETFDEVLVALCPGWAAWVTRMVRPEIVEAARKMRPDLVEREAGGEDGIQCHYSSSAREMPVIAAG
jgi:hypothetical protein